MGPHTSLSIVGAYLIGQSIIARATTVSTAPEPTWSISANNSASISELLPNFDISCKIVAYAHLQGSDVSEPNLYNVSVDCGDTSPNNGENPPSACTAIYEEHMNGTSTVSAVPKAPSLTAPCSSVVYSTKTILIPTPTSSPNSTKKMPTSVGESPSDSSKKPMASSTQGNTSKSPPASSSKQVGSSSSSKVAVQTQQAKQSSDNEKRSHNIRSVQRVRHFWARADKTSRQHSDHTRWKRKAPHLGDNPYVKTRNSLLKRQEARRGRGSLYKWIPKRDQGSAPIIPRVVPAQGIGNSKRDPGRPPPKYEAPKYESPAPRNVHWPPTFHRRGIENARYLPMIYRYDSFMEGRRVARDLSTSQGIERAENRLRWSHHRREAILNSVNVGRSREKSVDTVAKTKVIPTITSRSNKRSDFPNIP